MEHSMSEFGNASTYLMPGIWKRTSNLSDTDSHVENVWSLYKHGQNLVYILYFCTGLNCSSINSDNSENNLTSYPELNGTGIRPPNDISNKFNLIGVILYILIVIICLLGLLGNGRVIWLLGYNIKRNCFTTYVMNLSMADFGYLIYLLTFSIAAIGILLNWYDGSLAFCLRFQIVLELLFLTYSSSQFLLAVISIDRCVAVLFPIWHRCHRPPYLSTVVCAIIWIVFSLLSGIHFTLYYLDYYVSHLFIFQLIVTVPFCTPIMVISTLTLFIKVCCIPKQHLRGKLVTAVLLALLFFLFCCLPLNLSYIIQILYDSATGFLLMWSGFVCASVNSSINPLIYFLVGRRQKKGRAKISMKVALERVFKDEQDAVEEETPIEENHV